MKFHRRHILALPLALLARPASAASRPEVERDVVVTWYRLILELVRHTATYSPPVAARAFAYIGVNAHEAMASGNAELRSLAGQVNGLTAPPPRAAGEHDTACVLHAALAASAQNFFGNTGPTGQRAMQAMARQMAAMAMEGVASDVVARSTAQGEAIAAHILQWSLTDGGAVVENMGFPTSYTPGTDPQDWVPTSLVRQQQAALLPDWGNVRPFAMPDGNACGLPAPPAYSDDPASPFFLAAKEVRDTVANLTDEQRLIARFWSDDPMLSPTPPGHWIAIVLDIADRDALPADRLTETLATLGIAMADAFIGCWATKFEYNLLRPITYIRRHIDPSFEPLLITPPFPEYPSGHSTQSGAAATVLTAAFGENFAFDDYTHEDEGLPVRSYTSFWAAAEEAGISRLYGGIHYRFGVEDGLTQGRCIGAHAVALKTRA